MCHRDPPWTTDWQLRQQPPRKMLCQYWHPHGREHVLAEGASQGNAESEKWAGWGRTVLREKCGWIESREVREGQGGTEMTGCLAGQTEVLMGSKASGSTQTAKPNGRSRTKHKVPEHFLGRLSQSVITKTYCSAEHP